ncbi:hypothetical protein QMG61_09280 [Cryobacterium sp. PH31-AA6]|uniref:hypothetical protein n=1 Tax=Cryobacterium sp. PH31-AA6 TaxID=3046205 RepID=UPI0024B93DD8|nr:hypothetical protein [Cryobacterium sp. PH31-AA6]MDJ0323952.1 hypothetical protein [Cryobacterium sp. PH31-AA6]
MAQLRRRTAQAGALPAPSAEDEARRNYRRKRRFVRAGQAIMLVGALMAVVHWLTHIEAFGPEQPAVWLDLVAGYPMAAILLIVGASTAGRK